MLSAAASHRTTSVTIVENCSAHPRFARRDAAEQAGQPPAAMSQLRLWVGPDTLPGPERNAVSRRLIAGGPTGSRRRPTIPPVQLVGDGLPVRCLDGEQRSYLNLDTGASTNALPAVADRVNEFLPWYSSVHRGAGYKSQQATDAYEQARAAALCFAGRRPDADDVAVICRNTTDAINHLAYRLRLEPQDVVATTVVEHHANLLPWARVCRRRFVECEADGTFDLQAVSDVLRGRPRPRLLAITAASNVSGWLPPSATSSISPTSAAFRCWSTPPSWPPTGPYPSRLTSWRGAGTRCTPRSGPES